MWCFHSGAAFLLPIYLWAEKNHKGLDYHLSSYCEWEVAHRAAANKCLKVIIRLCLHLVPQGKNKFHHLFSWHSFLNPLCQVYCAANSLWEGNGAKPPVSLCSFPNSHTNWSCSPSFSDDSDMANYPFTSLQKDATGVTTWSKWENVPFSGIALWPWKLSPMVSKLSLELTLKL